MKAALDKFRERTDVPGIVAGLVDKDGSLELEAVGIRSRDQSSDMVAADDQVHIGSCGKAMTSALYARLVEAGVAEWDVPIASLFEDIDDVDPGWHSATIDDLLRCRAGVKPNPPMTEMKAMFENKAPLEDQRSAAATRVLGAGPKKPGTFVYSNLGYIVAGAAIERVAGATFEQAMATYVVEPLAMDSFGYGPPPLMAGHRPKLQLGPLTVGKGKALPRGDLRGDNPPLFTPAGRYHLTVADWAKFVTMFLCNGGDFLKPETVARLLDVPQDNKRSIAMGWASAEPHGSYGMQGSNTMWSATALIDKDMTRAAMVVANDGRTTVLKNTALLAVGLLDGSAPV